MDINNDNDPTPGFPKDASGHACFGNRFRKRHPVSEGAGKVSETVDPSTTHVYPSISTSNI